MQQMMTHFFRLGRGFNIGMDNVTNQEQADADLGENPGRNYGDSDDLRSTPSDNEEERPDSGIKMKFGSTLL